MLERFGSLSDEHLLQAQIMLIATAKWERHTNLHAHTATSRLLVEKATSVHVAEKITVAETETATIAFRRPTMGEQKKQAGLMDLVLVVLLMLLGFGLRVWHLDSPSKLYFDEVYYVDAAQKLWSGAPDPNSVHPPLGKWLIGLGIEGSKSLLGADVSEAFGWRIASAVAGTLMVGITYALGLLLFGYHRPAAGFAGLIVATEHLHLAMSRIAMLDPFLALFCLLGIWGSLAYFLGGHERWAVLGAFSLGLATGCKWSGVLTAFACLVAGWWIDRRELTLERTQRYFLWLLLLVPLGFFLSYLHLFLSDGFNLGTFKTIFGQGERMVSFRYDAKQFTHRYISYFYSWPLVLKPIWLFFEENKTTGKTVVNAICAMGTPVLWWGFTVLLIERAYTAFKTKNAVVGALVIIWVLQWLPWAASTTGGFFYYMLTEVPIMALLVGKLLADLFNVEDALGEGRWRGWLVLGLYLVGSGLYFPFATGFSVARPYFNKLFFTAWI